MTTPPTIGDLMRTARHDALAVARALRGPLTVVTSREASHPTLWTTTITCPYCASPLTDPTCAIDAMPGAAVWSVTTSADCSNPDCDGSFDITVRLAPRRRPHRRRVHHQRDRTAPAAGLVDTLTNP